MLHRCRHDSSHDSSPLFFIAIEIAQKIERKESVSTSLEIFVIETFVKS